MIRGHVLRLVALGAVVMAPLTAEAATALDRVQLQSGMLQGVRAEDVTAFKGIPYAAPPVGPLRWRPPAPAPILEPDRRLAALQARSGAPAYLYYFSYVPEASRLSRGAPHGAELPYVFETLSPTPISVDGHEIAAATPADEAMARAMHAYWVAFAETGAPGAAGGPRWPAYDASSDALVEFGPSGVSVRRGLLRPQLDAITGAVTAPGH